MENIRILIIDSGINVSNERISNISVKDFNVEGDYIDYCNHGTRCAIEILKQCKNVELTSFNIYRNLDKDVIENFYEALNYSVMNNFNIINMSLSFRDEDIDMENKLNIITEKLYANNVLLIGSKNINVKEPRIPGKLNNVYEVIGNDNLKNEEFYVDGYNLYASSDASIYLNKGEVEKFTSNSKATATMTGLIAKFMYESKCIDIRKVKNILLEKSINKSDFLKLKEAENQIGLSKKYDISKKNIKKIANIIQDVCKLSEEEKCFLFDYEILCNLTGVKAHNFRDIVLNINKVFNKNINIEEMHYSDFKSIYTLGEYLDREV